MCRGGALAVNEAGIPIPKIAKWSAFARPPYAQSLDPAQCGHHEPASALRGVCFEAAGHEVPHPENVPSVGEIALFHYATKSLEDFQEKMARGSGISKTSKGMAYFDSIAR